MNMKVLFICNQNENRSKTAEKLFKRDFRTKSAGLFNQKPVTKGQIAWADIIMVMENEQRTEISKRFPELYLQKRILSLEIKDIYRYNQPELIKELKKKVNEFILAIPQIAS